MESNSNHPDMQSKHKGGNKSKHMKESVIHTLNYICLSLMICMTEILKHDVNSNYKLPRMGKQS